MKADFEADFGDVFVGLAEQEHGVTDADRSDISDEWMPGLLRKDVGKMVLADMAGGRNAS